MHEETNVISNKYSFIPLKEFGQLIKAIETQDNAVIVPIPWEIINVGGTIMDKGLIVLKLIFRICVKSKKPINKKICLELILGFSFLEINIRIPLQISISKKLIIMENIRLKFWIWRVTNSYEDIIENTIQNDKIKSLSNFLIWADFREGYWLLIHKIFIFFIRLVRFCTEYK